MPPSDPDPVGRRIAIEGRGKESIKTYSSPSTSIQVPAKVASLDREIHEDMGVEP